jgi:diacylglycerol kinase (ATP)
VEVRPAIAVIINPVSGGARPDDARTRAELAVRVVEAHGDRCEPFVTERPGHAKQLAKAAAGRGVRLVLAWGGDGTINEVASALAFGDVPMGIVPAGSGNGLATELGADRRADRAMADALRAEPRPIDVGELEGRLFVNVAGVGIDAYVAAQFNAPGNRRRGFLAYARITGRALITYAPAQYRIAADSGTIEARAVMVTVANSAQFGNNARIAPLARVDDGLLDVVVVAEESRVRTLRQLPRLFNGTMAQAPGCSMLRVRRATIECDQPMTFHVDGEPVAAGTCLKARVHPGALLVATK